MIIGNLPRGYDPAKNDIIYKDSNHWMPILI